MRFLLFSLLIILAGIAYLSLAPSEIVNDGNDKVGHLIAYACLMVNFGLLTYFNRKKYTFAIVFTLFYGGSMEIIQYFVPGRCMSIYDMLANTAGVMFGVIIIRFFYHQMKAILKKLGIKLQ